MENVDLTVPFHKVAFLGGFLPRQTHTSALTTHLCHAFASEFGCDCLGIAMSDVRRRYAYPTRVRFEVSQANLDTYQAAAEFLNLNDVDLVCILHDFQIFDGEAGSYILALAQALKIPLVTILNNLPLAPDAAQQRTITGLVALSSRLITLNQSSVQLLEQAYSIPAEKIDFIEIPENLSVMLSDSPVWRDLARHVMDTFQKARQFAADQARQAAYHAQIPVTGGNGTGDIEELPVLRLDHFLRMTDETGMLKSSIISLPDYSQGYTTADNARALMFSLLLEQAGEGPFIPIEMQASRHLAFLWNAFNPDRGRFRDAMSYTRQWVDEAGAEDTHGIVVWALGMTLGRTNHPGMQGVARRLFEAALPALNEFSSLRAWSFGLLGIQEYLRRYSGDRQVGRTANLLLGRLTHLYQKRAAVDWPWFEETLAANSASVSQALIVSGHWAGQPGVSEIGLKSLDWLSSMQFTPEGMYMPLGDDGYYRRGGKPARFAQRPIEARSMISACLEAYRYTGDMKWLNNARGAFQWFLGRNVLGQPLYDPETGGCCDGLLPGRADPNYSSEALLAFLVAQLEMRLFDQLYRRRSEHAPDLPILQIRSPSNLIGP